MIYWFQAIFQDDPRANKLVETITNTEDLMRNNAQLNEQEMKNNYTHFMEQYKMVHQVVEENIKRIEEKKERNDLLVFDVSVNDFGTVVLAA